MAEIYVKAYSRQRDGGSKVSPHFKVREFACHDGSDPVFIAPILLGVLEDIREHFGKPIIINSGYRTPAYNASKGGARYSQHLYGKAADIQIRGVSPEAVADYARKVMPNFGGVGRYRTFTHVDVRNAVANWRGK